MLRQSLIFCAKTTFSQNKTDNNLTVRFEISLPLILSIDKTACVHSLCFLFCLLK